MRLPKPFLTAIFGMSIATPLAIAWAAQQGEHAIVYGPNYAQDRAEIEDLMSRYLYAFDWQDAEAYAATFTKDGVLEFAGGTERGHEELKKVMRDMAVREKAKADASFPPRRHRVRHYVTNLVLEIDGETARLLVGIQQRRARRAALSRHLRSLRGRTGAGRRALAVRAPQDLQRGEPGTAGDGPEPGFAALVAAELH
jgi:uncharacterized protein (TIGR02246 family)